MVAYSFDFVFAILFALTTIAKADDVRIAVFDWASEWDETTNTFGANYSPDDGGVTQIMEAQFYLAAQAFNERNADLLPVLGTLGGCNKNISAAWFCDTGGNGRVAFGDLLELANLPQPPHVVVGPVRSAEAAPMAMASSVLGSIPIISHWATSPRLADKSLFPQFMRTVPSDYASVIVLNRMFRQFNWTRAYLIFESTDFGAGWKDALFTEMQKDGNTLKFSAINFNSYSSMLQACKAAYASKVTVVVLVITSNQMSLFAEAWKESKLNENKPTMVFASLDNVQGLITDAGEDPLVAELAHASLSFQVAITENPQWTAYKQKFADGYFSQYESFVEESFPPNGLGNTNTGCANSNRTYPLPAGSLGPSALEVVMDAWTWAFDAVIAVGLATCELYPTNPLPSTFTSELYASMVNVKFDGLSGRVQFDNTTGDRDPLTSGFLLVNFVRSDPATNVIAASSIGDWDAETEEWIFTDVDSISFPLGKGLANAKDILIPDHNYNYLPMGWKIWGYVETAILNLACMYCMFWLWVNRRDKMVINAQGTFLMVIVFGCMVASWSILALTVDDNPDDIFNETVSCNAAFILFGFGFQLALLALIVKVYRIYMIFKASTKLKRGSYRSRPMLFMVGLLMVFESTILILWVSLAPLQWERNILQMDEFGNPMVSSGQCAGGPISVVFLVIVFTFHALSLLLTSIVSNQVRDLPVQYQESKYVNMAILSTLQIFLVSVPTVVASYAEVIGRFVIMTSVVFVSIGALLMFLILPKIFPTYFEMRTDPTHSSDINVATERSSKKLQPASPQNSSKLQIVSSHNVVASSPSLD